jgi:putative redox protein
MSHTTKATHVDGLAFEMELQGHSFTVDADAAVGGKDRGPTPKPLILSALAGCTGMDVASILAKMKMPYDSFVLEVEGDTSESHPKVYTDIRLRYVFAGDSLDRGKIEKAVDLSLDRYCGVATMLKQVTNLTHEISLNP